MATSLAAWANAILLAISLTRRGHYRMDGRLKARLPRILVSGLLMGLLLLLGLWLLAEQFQRQRARFISSVWGLVFWWLGGIVSYFALAHVSGAMTLAEMRAALQNANVFSSAGICGHKAA